MVNAWHNADGLYIKYGLSEGGTLNPGGQILAHGPYRIVEVELTGTSLTSAAAVVHDGIVIPKNARIDKVEVVAKTLMDSAGGTAKLNVGLIKLDRSTEIDYDGLIAQLPEASMDPAGDWQTIDVNHAQKGALIGTTTAYKGLLTADYDTEAFTAGVIKLRVYYYRTA